MSSLRAKLIINPHADLGRASQKSDELNPIIKEFEGVDCIETSYPSHAMEIAEQAADEGYGLIIAAGGDGTAHEVINGIMKTPSGRRPRLGVVPLGSGNDFSFAVGVDSNPVNALRQALTGESKWVDIGRFTDGMGRDGYFANAIGIGFDTVVTIRSRRLTFFQGFFLYLAAVVQTIILNHDAPRMQVKTDLEEWDQEMLMLVLCNGGREGGGFRINPQAKPDDGVFHYAGINKVSRPMMFRLIPEVMKGTHGRFPQVRMGEFHSLELKSDKPLYIHTDGEILTGFDADVRQLMVEILPAEIEISI